MYYYMMNINTVSLSSFASFSGCLHIGAKLGYECLEVTFVYETLSLSPEEQVL